MSGRAAGQSVGASIAIDPNRSESTQSDLTKILDWMPASEADR